jgi:hypothetical protein
VDANGQPIDMNVRERQDLNRALRAHKELDKIAYARIMKACRLNPKTKLLCESGNFKTANEILVRLRQRFHSVDETMKASDLLRYSTLKQQEGESGADFVDREQRIYTALREMGINVDDSLRYYQIYSAGYNKLKEQVIGSDYFHYSQYDSLSCDFTFETYNPGSSSSLAPAPSVNALFCRYCKKNGHAIQSCTKKSKYEQQKKKRKPQT